MAVPTRLPISPTSGHLRATRLHAIRIGSWLAREVLTNRRRLTRYAGAGCLTAAALSLLVFVVHEARGSRAHPKDIVRHKDVPLRHLPYPQLEFPLEIDNGQYAPLAWAD